MTDKNKTIMYLIDSVDNIRTWMKKFNDNFMKYVKNMDGWVKEINKKVNNFDYVEREMSENQDNIQHTYELVYELKDQIEEMKQEISALKLIQIISIKRNKIIKEHDSQTSP